MLKDYKFIRHLVYGNGTQINLVESLQTQTKYAAKHVLCDSLEKHQKFLYEHHLHLTVAKHPTIVNVCSNLIDEGKEKVLLLEYLPGGDLLDEVNRRKRFSEDETKVIIHQLLDAIVYVHSKNIVHRDLKLENVVLQDRNDISTVRLIDFGLAKEDDGSNTLCGICGTYPYMAPEIYSHSHYGKAVDMWALGVMTYTLLCSALPFGDNRQHCEKAVRHAPTFHERAWLSISLEAKNFIMQLLTQNPSQRLSAIDALNHPWLQTLDIALSPQSTEVITNVAPESKKKRRLEDENCDSNELEVTVKNRRLLTVTGG